MLGFENVIGLNIGYMSSLPLARIRGWSRLIPEECRWIFWLVGGIVVACFALYICYEHIVVRRQWISQATQQTVEKELKTVGSHLGWACEAIIQKSIPIDPALVKNTLLAAEYEHQQVAIVKLCASLQLTDMREMIERILLQETLVSKANKKPLSDLGEECKRGLKLMGDTKNEDKKSDLKNK